MGDVRIDYTCARETKVNQLAGNYLAVAVRRFLGVWSYALHCGSLTILDLTTGGGASPTTATRWLVDIDLQKWMNSATLLQAGFDFSKTKMQASRDFGGSSMTARWSWAMALPRRTYADFGGVLFETRPALNPDGWRWCGTTTTLKIPVWFLIAGSFVLPMLWHFQRDRKKLPALTSRCRVCGYDLQATPYRCPECGTAPEKPDTWLEKLKTPLA